MSSRFGMRVVRHVAWRLFLFLVHHQNSWVAFGIGTLGIRVVGGAGRHDRALRIPVLVYVCVISTMVAFAVATESPWLIAAALLFYGSDLMLGWDRFVKPRAFSGLAVMVTYHLAQAGFVVFLLTR